LLSRSSAPETKYATASATRREMSIVARAIRRTRKRHVSAFDGGVSPVMVGARSESRADGIGALLAAAARARLKKTCALGPQETCGPPKKVVAVARARPIAFAQYGGGKTIRPAHSGTHLTDAMRRVLCDVPLWFLRSAMRYAREVVAPERG